MGNQDTKRRKQMRFPGFDYSQAGMYFVTIVTQGRKNMFGTVIDGEVSLNEAGTMIAETYESLQQRFHGLFCLDYVIMPNHFHCILYLDQNVEVALPRIIDSLKSITTVEYINGVKSLGWEPFDGALWQRNYWDDIIWNNRQFEYVQRYIAMNPARWIYDNINIGHVAKTDHVIQGLKALR